MPFQIVDCRRISIPKSTEEDCVEPYLVRFEHGSYAKVWKGEPNQWEDYWYVAMLDDHDGEWLETDYDPVYEGYFVQLEEESAEKTMERVLKRFDLLG